MALEIRQLGEHSWAIPGHVTTGFFVQDGGSYLIDSGGDESAGRKLLRTLEEADAPLRCIVNTHSHADHIGGNAFLQKRTGCRIAATRENALFIEAPWHEPFFLWSAAAPAQLQTKFLMAPPSTVQIIAPGNGPIPETPLEAVELSGHMPGMIGVRTPDDVFFVADAVFSEEILAKYPIPFCADVEAALSTLDRLEQTSARFFVPAHAPITSDIAPLAAANRRRLQEIADRMENLLAAPRTREELLTAVLDSYGIQLDFVQYGLLFATISAFLTYLHAGDRILPDFQDNRLFWRRKS